MYMYILQGLRLVPPTRTLKTSRPPDRLHVTSSGPRNRRREPSIVQAHSVWTIGLLGEVREGFRGVPCGSPQAPGILVGGAWRLWEVAGGARGSLGNP